VSGVITNIRVDAAAEFAAQRVGGEPGITPTTTEATEGPSFAAVLKKTVEAASAQENVAVAKAEDLAAGRTDDLHGTMIAMKEADISLKLVGNVRNKLLDAFHELWRTSV
jgi:flagellar hook-basal body complex protein FliE